MSKNQTKLVSVIVPIYGVEKYLENCLTSILNQTYRNLEIILVDDGSPDNCGAICDEYALKDSRIKVIHKQNQGLGYARNTGLEIAMGEYVYFIDSDDWIELNTIETLVSNMISNDVDLVMMGFKKSTETQSTSYSIVDKNTLYIGDSVQKKVLLPMVAQDSSIKEDFTINMCVWTNLYKREIIEKNNISFFSEREYLSEDICFNLSYLLNTQKMVIIPETLYNYRYNPTSLTNKYKGNEFDKLKKLYSEIQNIITQGNLNYIVEYRTERFFITKTREILFRIANDSALSKQEKNRICNEIINDSLCRKVLDTYPVSSYIAKYKIIAYLMIRRKNRLLIQFLRFVTSVRKMKVRFSK